METLALEPAVLNSKSRVPWTRLGRRLKGSHSFQTTRWRRWSAKFMPCSKKRASLPTTTPGLPRSLRPISNRSYSLRFRMRLQIPQVPRLTRDNRKEAGGRGSPGLPIEWHGYEITDPYDSRIDVLYPPVLSGIKLGSW